MLSFMAINQNRNRKSLPVNAIIIILDYFPKKGNSDRRALFYKQNIYSDWMSLIAFFLWEDNTNKCQEDFPSAYVWPSLIVFRECSDIKTNLSPSNASLSAN